MDLSKLSREAREVVDVARAVVRRWRSNHLGTEHILLGLLTQQGGMLRRVFEEFELDLALAQTKTNDAIRRRDFERLRSASDVIQPTPNARRALRLAVEEAEAQGLEQAGANHLLLGLLMVDDCTAARVLRETGLTEADVRLAIRKVGRDTSPLGNGVGNPESLLLRYGRDLTRLAREGRLNPVVGREAEITYPPHQEQPGYRRGAGRREDIDCRGSGAENRRWLCTRGACREPGDRSRSWFAYCGSKVSGRVRRTAQGHH